MENLISGLFVSFQSAGEALGPSVASILSDQFGFQTAQEVYVVYLFTFTTLYFMLCGNFSMFGCATVLPEEEEYLV